MSIPNENCKSSAVSNALLSIHKGKRFPHKVLVGGWEDYLFFEPHLIFVPSFIELKNLLLEGEGASVIALINLGNTVSIDYDEPPSIFIYQETKAKEYISELESEGAPMSWRFLVDRYVCASDQGTWSIYCERENDVAVFAFRKEFPSSIHLEVEERLKAKSIKFSSSEGDVERFDFGKLLPDWRSTLETEYTVAPLGS